MAAIRSIGVVGAGQMGSGIAQLAAVHGVDVCLYDTEAEALNRAHKSISSNIRRLVSKALLSEVNFSVFSIDFFIKIKIIFMEEQSCKTVPNGFAERGGDAIRRLKCSQNLEDFQSVDIVIEAIVESESVKKKLFVDLDKIVKSSAILASNTSSISITRLASATNRPTQVIGMHFMNPPPIMKLVEIIRGADTSDETYNVTKSLAERFGKTVVCSQDYAGFIVNRILMPMINEAFYTLYNGVAAKEHIDAGMKFGTNHPMGPLELADFIGLDVCLAILKVLHGGLGDTKYVPCPLLVQYVDAGRLGRKRGIGVYDYRNAPGDTKPSSRL
nr:3-hydroxybutyryl-CoA dehydrogenase [Ipomoea batatas]